MTAFDLRTVICLRTQRGGLHGMRKLANIPGQSLYCSASRLIFPFIADLQRVIALLTD